MKDGMEGWNTRGGRGGGGMEERERRTTYPVYPYPITKRRPLYTIHAW